VVAALLLLAACSKDKDIDTPALLKPFNATLKVDRVWTAKVDDKKSAPLRLALALKVDSGRVYAAGHKGGVAAFDLNTGRQIWRIRIKAPLAGGAGANGDLVAVGSTRGDVVALSAANGSTLWKVRLNGEVLAAPAISERLVAVRTVDGKLHGLSPKDGHELWSVEQQVPRLSLRGTASPVRIGELALCGFDNGKVIAVNINDGSVQWEQTVAPPHGRTELERLVDIDSAVDVSGQDVYAVSFQGRIAMLALDTGQVWWSHDASSYRGLGLDDGALYMASADGDVVAMQKRTGVEMWRQNALAHRRLSTVVASDDALVAADFQGYVHWFDKTTGALAARVKTGKVRISTPPIVAGNMVLVVNDAGNISAFRVSRIPGAKAGAPAAAAAPPSTPADAPAAADAAAPADATAPAPEPAGTSTPTPAPATATPDKPASPN
jgi:outer membrane protein assembly factor BamB